MIQMHTKEVLKPNLNLNNSNNNKFKNNLNNNNNNNKYNKFKDLVPLKAEMLVILILTDIHIVVIGLMV